MTDSVIQTHLEHLASRRTEGGGFAGHPGGAYRPDCTAWAILILQAGQWDRERLQAARARLALDLQEDGRLCMSRTHPDAVWPTPLAVLAWMGAPAYQEARARAIQFLLDVQGVHWEKDPTNTIIGHDPSIPGWPWILHTHSWVHPTALAMIALTAAGLAGHPRIRHGVHLLLDRQLPHGGWNYGNTTVWGQELQPFPETTGMALNALAGLVPSREIHRSLEYLRAIVPTLRTPVSLGWSLLGLRAWAHIPSEADRWIEDCFHRQRRYGTYDTVALCLLLAAHLAPRGLASLAILRRHLAGKPPTKPSPERLHHV